MNPLEIIYFAVVLPGTAISTIGLALLADDGRLMLIACVLSAAALSTFAWYFVL